MWSGDSSKDAGVAVLVRSEWIDKVVNVNRVNERIVVIKLVIGAVLVNVLSVYAPQVGRTIEEKDKFWEELFDIVNNIPSTEKVVVAGDLNGHIGEERDGYETIHGGYSFGMRNAEGERILEFADATNMVVCNSVFKKRESQLITYESGGVRSTVDYILMRNRDRQCVRNVKTIPGEECVRQHRLLIADLRFAGTTRRRKTYVPKLKTWKLRDKNLKQEFADKLKVQNTKNGTNDGVDEKWERMRDILLTTAKDVCGISRQPPRHKETWWWNEEVAKAVKNKREIFKNWQKNKTNQNREHYREAKRNCKKSIAIAKKAKSEKFADELDCEEGRRRVFRIAKQLARDGQDVVNVNCLKDKSGKVVVDNEEIKRIW